MSMSAFSKIIPMCETTLYTNENIYKQSNNHAVVETWTTQVESDFFSNDK